MAKTERTATASTTDAMTYDPATDHDKPPGIFNHFNSDGRRGKRMNSGRTWLVDGTNMKLTEIVKAAPGSNMSAARRDIVNGVMSAQDFVDKYRNRQTTQEPNT